MIKVTDEDIREVVHDRIVDNPLADLNDLDVSEVTDMSFLFSHMTKPHTSTDKRCGDAYTSDFDGIKIDNTFFGGDISRWDTKKVLDMSWMFDGNRCFKGDISHWNTSNVIDMTHMFANSVFDGDISNWNVSKVTNMFWMFGDCNFNNDISRWIVNKVIDMVGMFWKNKKFNYDISHWIINKKCKYEYMFEESSYDKTLPLGIDPKVAFGDNYTSERVFKYRLDEVIKTL